MTHISNTQAIRRENAVRTLGALGVDSDAVITGILPTLIDKNVSTPT